ncbi:MAG: MFS transporter [Gemmatimonadetes bacterium]|nr:MFS transporter [Gemmatimonadota bacterium]
MSQAHRRAGRSETTRDSGFGGACSFDIPEYRSSHLPVNRIFHRAPMLARLGSRWKAAGLLSITDFRYLWISSSIWWQTRWMDELIVGWVVLELTDSAGMVALVSFCRMAPFMLFGPFFSTVVRYVSYRWLIVNAQFINCTVSGLFWALAFFGDLAFWHIVVGSILIGMGSAYDWSSRRALIPDLVGKDRTTDAMVMETVPQNISRLIGPLMSGILLEFTGTKGGFLALFLLQIVQIAVIVRLSSDTDRTDRKKSRLAPWKDLLLAYRYSRRNPRISGVLIITFLMNAFAFSYQVLLPVFVRDVLFLGPMELGLLGAGTGIGSILGIALIDRLGRYYREGIIFTVSSLLNAVATLIFALSMSFSLSLAMLILVGIGQTGFSIMQSSIILRYSIDAMRARVMGLLVLAIGGGPPGRLLVGSLAGVVGAPLALATCAGVASMGVVSVLWRLGGMRKN